MSLTNQSLAPFKADENPQGFVLSSSLGYIWDVPTLQWVKDTGSSGGGGAVTVADGADVAQGAKADAAWVSGDGTVISLLKTIASSGGGAVTIADGTDVAEGALADAAVVTDAAGTVSGKLRGLVKWAFERMPASLGQKTMTASLPVVVSSDQSAVPVSGTFWQATQPVSGTVTASGPLTNAELRATAVPVSGTVTASGPLTDTQLRATPVPVSGTVTVGGTVTANAGTGTLAVSAASLPLPTGASTSALQTQPGVDIGDVTVNNAAGASAVNVQDGGNSITVDAVSLPLPTGASTETTLGTRLADATFTGRINVLGQKTMAASTPVVLASDQTTLNVASAEASVLFKGRSCTFRTPGRAGTAGQKILSLHNATGSSVTVTVSFVAVDMYQTVVKAITVPPPNVRLWKVTVLPTNGTTLTKNKIGGTTTSSASVTVLGDASADGTGSGTTLTATLPAGTFISQQFASRFITAAGYEVADRLEFFPRSTVKLGALEGLVVFLDYTVATMNPTTDMWTASIEWTEV